MMFLRHGKIDSGFTLVEMLVTLTIAALLVSVAITLHSPVRNRNSHLKLAARQLVADFRAVRSTAVLSASKRSLEFRLSEQRYRWAGDGDWKLLPQGVSFSFPGRAEEDPVLVAFRPDGSSSDISVRVLQGDVGRTIQIHPLTGRVTEE